MLEHCTKKLAIQIVSDHLPNHNVTHNNSVFSNINIAKPVWWIDPANKKFEQDLFLIFNNSNIELIVFFIPSNSFTFPQKLFRQRNEKNCSHIEIATRDPEYKDLLKSKTSFLPFLLTRIPLK